MPNTIITDENENSKDNDNSHWYLKTSYQSNNYIIITCHVSCETSPLFPTTQQSIVWGGMVGPLCLYLFTATGENN